MNVSLPLSERVLIACGVVAFWWALTVLAKRKLPERPFLLVFRALFFILMLGDGVCFVLDQERQLGGLLGINAWGSWWVSLVLQKKFGTLEQRPISLNLSGREPGGNPLR